MSRIHTLRVEAVRVIVIRDRSLKIPLLATGIAPVVERFSALGVEADCFVVIGDRLV
jgi:hypothetical protein